MRRTLRRRIAGTCACIGAFLLAIAVIDVVVAHSVAGLFPIVVVGLFLIAFWPRWQRLKRYDRETFNWYQAQHPGLVQRGRIRCHKCESDQIGTQSLRQHTYTRAHFCRTCGTTLYYSPEI